MSTVTAKVEPATRLASLLVDQLTAPVKFTQAARELVHDGVTTFVEVGPGNVLSGLVKRIDRSVRDDLRERPREPREGAGGPARRERLLLARGEDRARHRRLARDRPRDRTRARCGGRDGRRRLPHRPARRPRRSPREIGGRAVQADVSDPESAAALVEAAGDVDILVNNAGLTRDGLLARMSDDDWRHRDRDEPLVRLLHLPRGGAADDEEARGARSSTCRRSSASTATGARRTTPPRRRGSSASRSRSPASSAAASVRANVVAPGYVQTQLTEVLPEEATKAMLDADAARPARRSRRTSRARSGSCAPTRPRSSRAKCCSSTAASACSLLSRDRLERQTQDRRHRARRGDVAREHDRGHLGGPDRRAVGCRADHAVRLDRVLRPLRVRGQGPRGHRLRRLQGVAPDGPLHTSRARCSAPGGGGFGPRDRADRRPRRRGRGNRDRRPEVVRVVRRPAERAGRPTASTRSRSCRSSRTSPPAGCRSSSAREGRCSPSAPRVPPRTWRSATGWMRSGWAGPT